MTLRRENLIYNPDNFTALLTVDGGDELHVSINELNVPRLPTLPEEDHGVNASMVDLFLNDDIDGDRDDEASSDHCTAGTYVPIDDV